MSEAASSKLLGTRDTDDTAIDRKSTIPTHNQPLFARSVSLQSPFISRLQGTAPSTPATLKVDSSMTTPSAFEMAFSPSNISIASTSRTVFLSPRSAISSPQRGDPCKPIAETEWELSKLANVDDDNVPIVFNVNNTIKRPDSPSKERQYKRRLNREDRRRKSKVELTSSFLTPEQRRARLLEIQRLKQLLIAEEMLLCPDGHTVFYTDALTAPINMQRALAQHIPAEWTPKESKSGSSEVNGKISHIAKAPAFSPVRVASGKATGEVFDCLATPIKAPVDGVWEQQGVTEAVETKAEDANPEDEHSHPLVEACTDVAQLSSALIRPPTAKFTALTGAGSDALTLSLAQLSLQRSSSTTAQSAHMVADQANFPAEHPSVDPRHCPLYRLAERKHRRNVGLRGVLGRPLVAESVGGAVGAVGAVGEDGICCVAALERLRMPRARQYSVEYSESSTASSSDAAEEEAESEEEDSTESATETGIAEGLVTQRYVGKGGVRARKEARVRMRGISVNDILRDVDFTGEEDEDEEDGVGESDEDMYVTGDEAESVEAEEEDVEEDYDEDVDDDVEEDAEEDAEGGVEEDSDYDVVEDEDEDEEEDAEDEDALLGDVEDSAEASDEDADDYDVEDEDGDVEGVAEDEDEDDGDEEEDVEDDVEEEAEEEEEDATDVSDDSDVSTSCLLGCDDNASSDTESSTDDDKKCKFPYESNVIALSHSYDLVRRVASNTDTVVYEGYCRATGAHVAIKVRDEWSRRRHDKELRLFTAVQGHKLFPSVLAWHRFRDTKTVAIAMEYCGSSDVSVLFNRPWAIKQYALSMLLALQHLHRRNILYRDIKPSNIMWDDERSQAKIIDFDVSTFSSEYKGRLHRRYVGTDGYMSPELVLVKRCRKEKRPCVYKGYGFSTDAFSAGVVFAQLIYRKYEEDITDDDNLDCKADKFRERAMRELDLMHEEGVEPSFDPRALEIVVGLLAPEPSERMSVSEAAAHGYFSDCYYDKRDGVVKLKEEADQ